MCQILVVRETYGVCMFAGNDGVGGKISVDFGKGVPGACVSANGGRRTVRREVVRRRNFKYVPGPTSSNSFEFPVCLSAPVTTV